MNLQEIKEAYYQLALAEIHHMVESRGSIGRPFNTDKWLKLAYLICVEDKSLYRAAELVNLKMSYIYERKLRFIGVRPSKTGNCGHHERKFYTLEYKQMQVARILSGEQYSTVTQETGVRYITLSRWVLQQATGKLR